MRACLEGYFARRPRPERLARRCYAAALHTDQWRLARRARGARVRFRPMDRELVAFLFPPEVFGSPE